MNSLPFSKIRLFVILAAFLLVAGGIGYRLGERHVRVATGDNRSLILRQDPPKDVDVDFSLFWVVWQKLFRYYIDSASLEPQKLVWGAISGMVSATQDPYTSFFPPKENKEFKDDLGGEFEGIGAQLGIKDNHLMVVSPLKGNPAAKAGILAGDWILKVNGEEASSWSVADAVAKIRGPRGTTVHLTILHEKGIKPIELAIARQTIMIPSVESWVKTVGNISEIKDASSSAILGHKTASVAYIRLNRFGDHSNEDWTAAVNQIVKSAKNTPLKGLVFDLRNNPGGYLDGAVYIASEFVPRGKTVVSQLNSDGSKQDYPANRAGQLLDMPVVVIINKGSASASEITAGALHDYGRATIVGETSFGKGSVQTPFDLSGGAAVHITTGKWLTPSGTSISKTGITPDIAVSLDGYTETNDPQLSKAIEQLVK